MRKITLFLSLLLTILLFQSCNNQDGQSSSKTEAQKSQLPSLLSTGLDAHGGLELWKEMQAMTFAFNRGEASELQQISLKDRKALIIRDSVQVGFDGKEVWVAPNKAAFGKSSARFYHNLMFYIYAMPFVLADDGIIYEAVPERIIDEVSYKGVKVTYEAGVGDAPDDYYIAYFHPETGELYLLLYTVTYYQGGPNNKFKALVYESWQEVNGLKLPLKMVGYKFENDRLGEKRYERNFLAAKLSKAPFEADMFEMPKVAEIDALIQN